MNSNDSNNKLFRRKPMKQLSSMEQTDDLILVENPKSWMILGAVTLLLIGLIVWSIFGRLNTIVQVIVVSDGQQAICYIPDTSIQDLPEDCKVTAADSSYSIVSIDSSPVKASDVLTEYEMHVGDLSSSQWLIKASLDQEMDPGVYSAAIAIESVSPISLIFN